MNLLTGEFFFEFEAECEGNKELYVSFETDIQSGGYTFEIFTEKPCGGHAFDLSQIIKDMNISLYSDIDKAVFKASEQLREEAVNEWKSEDLYRQDIVMEEEKDAV